jgi:hypothetical protein
MNSHDAADYRHFELQQHIPLQQSLALRLVFIVNPPAYAIVTNPNKIKLGQQRFAQSQIGRRS